MAHDILIVGAGAAGLFAARELAQAGRKVFIVEARNRIGGRIYPLPESEFGYPAQGGAEFIHGEAAISREILKTAGATFEHSGEWWSTFDGEPRSDESPTPHNESLEEKLKALKEDMPIAAFFDHYLGEPKYARLRDYIFRRVEGYDAADPARFSAFALREQIFGEGGWGDLMAKEGYTLLLQALERDWAKSGVEIILNREVRRIELGARCVKLTCADRSIFEASQALLTVPLPILAKIEFKPALPEKREAANGIGFGTVIKILLRFKDRWWVKARGRDFSRMSFVFSKETVPTWWTQYPEPHATLTGWVAGPKAQRLSNLSEAELLERALASLANIFQVEVERLRGELLVGRVVNWTEEPFTFGAYSYPTPQTKAAVEELLKPVDGRLFFAGEALYHGETGTVEAALSSGRDAAKRMLGR
ncbi:MAG TPA: NAD(P)/FAD-dependent oxidoreductase [Methylovirgula sp.]|nr:NAD(P)/FAD-dependent oxidoreductase [Methylovirgula sp.]